MSRKQLALFEPSLVRQALMDAVKKLSPRTVAQPGDVYRLGRQRADYRPGDCHGNGSPPGQRDVHRSHQPVAVVYRAVCQLCRGAGGRPQ